MNKRRKQLTQRGHLIPYLNNNKTAIISKEPCRERVRLLMEKRTLIEIKRVSKETWLLEAEQLFKMMTAVEEPKDASRCVVDCVNSGAKTTLHNK